MGHGAILPDRAGRRYWLGPGPMPLLFGSEGVDGRPWEIDPQLRARCVRLVRELPRGFPSHLAAAVATARQDGVPWWPVGLCPARGDVDHGTSPGVTSAGPPEVKRSKAENEQLCEDQEALRPASVLFAASSTRATSDPGVRRRDERRGLRGAAGPGGVGPVSQPASSSMPWSKTGSAIQSRQRQIGQITATLSRTCGCGLHHGLLRRE